MTWRDILKESMARDLTAEYGRDYIDAMIDEASDEDESAIANSVAYLINNKLVTKDSSRGEIYELLEKHKDDIMVDIYGGMQREPLSEIYTDSFPFSALADDVLREVKKILTPKTGR
jgi:hypothetical protein|tara:strand:+ start:571 stop:921 length:351 start_codon:yes stop_codon:yes gene_type:complete